MKMINFNKNLSTLVSELKINTNISSIERCVLLFQMTTYVGEDEFDNYKNMLEKKCTRELAQSFLDENSGVIDFQLLI